MLGVAVIDIKDVYNPKLLSSVLPLLNAGSAYKIRIINNSSFGVAALRGGNKHLMLINF
jgi:hypothetical protein